MRGAVAAGNRHTAEAGAWALRQGGSAVDAVVAAALAAFVAEGPLTGPAGGGFFLVRAAGAEPALLDCRKTMSKCVLVAWWAGSAAYACHTG